MWLAIFCRCRCDDSGCIKCDSGETATYYKCKIITIETAVYRTVRTVVERTGANHSLLLDYLFYSSILKYVIKADLHILPVLWIYISEKSFPGY